jgi:aspartyl-tRNA(Asn)/glutamyl-tRNA(Gln) amidotransferase subunit A
MYLSDIATVPVNIAGLPAISLPVGTDAKKLPIGMQIIGKKFDEAGILKAAYFYEQGNKDVVPEVGGVKL